MPSNREDADLFPICTSGFNSSLRYFVSLINSTALRTYASSNERNQAVHLFSLDSTEQPTAIHIPFCWYAKLTACPPTRSLKAHQRKSCQVSFTGKHEHQPLPGELSDFDHGPQGRPASHSFGVMLLSYHPVECYMSMK